MKKLITCLALILSATVSMATITGQTTNLCPGSQYQYTGAPGGTWSTSNSSRLTIDSNGLATAVATLGGIKIYHGYNDTVVAWSGLSVCYNVTAHIDTLSVTVTGSVQLIKYLGVGQTSITIACCAQITLTEGTNVVLWTVNDGSLGTITCCYSNGALYTPILQGMNIITATAASGCKSSLLIDCH